MLNLCVTVNFGGDDWRIFMQIYVKKTVQFIYSVRVTS